MYHEQTDQSLARRKRNRIIAIVVAVVLVLVAIASYAVIQANAREQAAASLRQSIVDAAKQCCAVEGSYPSSIDHLEEDYGLVINEEDYIITYEWFADNIPPSVVVIPR